MQHSLHPSLPGCDIEDTGRGPASVIVPDWRAVTPYTSIRVDIDDKIPGMKCKGNPSVSIRLNEWMKLSEGRVKVDARMIAIGFE